VFFARQEIVLVAHVEEDLAARQVAWEALALAALAALAAVAADDPLTSLAAKLSTCHQSCHPWCTRLLWEELVERKSEWHQGRAAAVCSLHCSDKGHSLHHMSPWTYLFVAEPAAVREVYP
jgi:hypothetical protein